MMIKLLIKDLHNFPVITISHQPEEQVSVDKTIQVYETLLAKQEAFVFISNGSISQEKTDHEARKIVASWVKNNRERLSKYVKALVHIETDENLRLEAQKFANNFIKFSGYPMFIVESQSEADQVIQSVLNRVK